MKLKEMFQLSDKSAKDLKKGIAACSLTNLSLLLSVGVITQVFMELLKPLEGAVLSYSRLWLLFAVGIVAVLIHYLCCKNDYHKTYVSCYTAAEDTRIRIAELVRKFPMYVFQDKGLTELTTNMMGDCASIEHSMSHIIPPLFANGISSTLICIGIMCFQWRIGLAIFATLPLSFLIIFGSRKLQEKGSQRQVEAKRKAASEEQEYLEGIKLVKACHLDGERFGKLNEALLHLKKESIRMELGTGVFISVAQFVLQTGIGITVFVGVQLLTDGSIDVTWLLLSLVIVCRMYGPILTILTLLPMLFHTLVSTKRMRQLSEIPLMTGSDTIPISNNKIEFQNVSFGYGHGEAEDTKEDVLKDISFSIPEGKVTALVGPSGSGKSTIAKLAARFWDVEKGSITVGDVDIRELEPEYLMSRMSFVFQDVTLFGDTIFNNIRVGNPAAGEEEILAAAKAAHCDEFVSRLPDGYQTMLGENGGTLSGGERQRISIARALLKNAPIVLLDEATSALDPENEVLLQNALSKLIAGKTVLVIAHRLRTITDADKIIVLNDGCVKEEGTHEELMEQRGLYQQLYELQNMSTQWSV